MDEILLKKIGHPGYHTLPGYRETGGYEALHWALSHQPEDLIDEIMRSGLRGRGGGGYPTGLKWQGVAQTTQTIPERYLVCNASEGEPGSLKDRYLLRHAPHMVLEGVWIAAHAIQAKKALLYIKSTFDEEIQGLHRALVECSSSHGLQDFLDAASLPPLEIVEGPDLYIAGEETAMLEVLQGRPPLPKQKPPYYPSIFGLYGKPTVVNNVETLANIPYIVRHGSAAFRQWGTEESPGTLLFSLTGDVVRPGVHELPLGSSLRQLIYEAGGGIPDGLALKAVFPGGPSFPMLRPDQIDLPLTYESVREAGSSLGGGSVHVFSSARCMVRLARRFAVFFKEGSCGQCPPCQMGTHNLVTLLQRIDEGTGTANDIESLNDLCRWMPGRGACGLVTGAAVSTGSLILNFPEEFREHQRKEHCLLRS